MYQLCKTVVLQDVLQDVLQEVVKVSSNLLCPFRVQKTRMSCCTNRGYNSAGCSESYLQAIRPIVVKVRRTLGFQLLGHMALRDRTQNAGTLTWTGNTSNHQLILTGGGYLPYQGCPSCPLLNATLQIATEDSSGNSSPVLVGKWRGTIQLVNGVVNGTLRKIQGVSSAFQYQVEGSYNLQCGEVQGQEIDGRTLVVHTLRLQPGIF